MDNQSAHTAKGDRARIYSNLRKQSEPRAEVARALKARHGRLIERAIQVARELRFGQER